MTQTNDPNRTVDEAPRQHFVVDDPGASPAPDLNSAHLELLEEITHGGMGAILRGRDVDFGRDVAVKVLLEDHRGRPELARRFLEEARIAGRLQHPGVVPVYSLGRLSDGRPYFTMKLIKGRTLTALLAERKEPAAGRPRFLAVFEQVCQTLAYAHAHGVIHRDLKPSNVMVGAYGEVQVMDWGLAKVLPRDGEADKERRDQPTEEVSVIQTPRGDSDTGESGEETQAGSVLGTPAYMAPEQARGMVEDVGMRSDVFGLGAILCEILTGRPPFVGPRDAALKRARHAELGDALGRLDGCGADAELIDLAKRCLSADAAGRPADAGEVSATVTAYRESVERRLRAAEVANAEARTKAAEGRKRRRLWGALAAVVLLTVTAGGGVWGWVAWDRAARRAAAERAADVALGQAQQAEDEARGIDEAADKMREVEPETPETAARAAALWRQALGSVEEAGRALATAPDSTAAARGRLAALRAEIEAGLERTEREARLLNDLDKARALRVAFLLGMGSDKESADRSYAAALEAYGAGKGGAVGQASAAVRAERPAVRLALVVALDDWAICIGGPEAAHLRGVADGADGDGWRRRYRAAASARDVEALKRLANEARGLELPAVSACALAVAVMGNAPAEAAALLRQARRQHPADFWLNLELGASLNVLSRSDPATLAEAAGAFWAAIALRPDNAGAHVYLGNVLGYQGDRAGAVACYKKAIELDPKNGTALINLGTMLREPGNRAEADAYYKKAIELNPNNAWIHNNLGGVLAGHGDRDWAVECFRKAIELDPKFGVALNNLGYELARQGDLAGAFACFKKANELDPKYGNAHNTLGLVLKDQDKLNEAIAEFREAVRLDPLFAAAHYNLGNALNAKKDLNGAAAAYRKAIEIDPKYAEAHCNLGHILRNQGQFRAALEELRTGHELGSKQPAWRYPSAQWVKDAERMVELDQRLSAIGEGKEKPADDAERLALARFCQQPFKKLYAASCRFYSEAFAHDAKLAADVQTGDRYNAACVAALAGRGQGDDADKLDDKEQARFRKQAVEWLRADLAYWTKQATSEKSGDRERVRQTLKHCQEDADLSGLRDAAELPKLPADEQQSCKKLWADVQALLDKTDVWK
jgi:eukaryotic-like serine/threonine-protein kinase